MRAFVSVVLPTFNRAGTLLRSARSVLNQSHRDLELIIVDDGSTDETHDIVDAISDSRLRYIKFDRNCGQSVARNAGIAASRADLIAFQDSDDVWLPRKLERQLSVLFAERELAGVYCDLWRRNISGESFLDQAPDLTFGALFDRRPTLYQSFGVGIQTCLLHRQPLVDSGAFKENLRCMEDLELILRLVRKYRLRRIPEALVEYYESEGSVSKDAAAERRARAFLLMRYGCRAFFDQPRMVLYQAKLCLSRRPKGRRAPVRHQTPSSQ
jgi:glycosyltransferase involved in cell wall biosynthesis